MGAPPAVGGDLAIAGGTLGQHLALYASWESICFIPGRTFSAVELARIIPSFGPCVKSNLRLPPRPEVNLRARKTKPYGLFLAPAGGFVL